MTTRALITGGTGFLGINLINSLVEKGWDLSVVTRANSNLKLLSRNISNVQILQHDGSFESMQLIIDKSSPEIVFHLATHFLSEHSSKDIDELIESNIRFGCQLLEALTSNQSKNIINTGTSWQHFGNSDYSPVNLYSSTKKAFEDILQYYHEARSFNVINFKLFDTYGPNDPRNKLFALLRNAYLEDKTILMSPGEQLIDLLYIEDVISGIIHSVDFFKEEKSFFSEFALSSGNTISLRQVVETYSKIFGKEIKVKWGGREYKKREIMRPWSKGNKLPGWNPEFDLTTGIKKMLDDENS